MLIDTGLRFGQGVFRDLLPMEMTLFMLDRKEDDVGYKIRYDDTYGVFDDCRTNIKVTFHFILFF